MQTPDQAMKNFIGRIPVPCRLAFASTFLMGLLIHMPVLLSDIPNHDGLDSMYFDQNMITSGRWFLTVACGFSSYFTVPWLIGLLGLFFLGVAAACLVELLEVKSRCNVILISGLLVSFPALSSTFAYVFTLDGYMLALCLAVLSVLLTKRCRRGFLWGAVCLAFSMGIYQAYLPFAILLCIYEILLLCMGDDTRGTKIKKSACYFYMGAVGVALYYLLLRLLLAIQGKELASYQGIDGMTEMSGGLLRNIAGIYRDFAAFTLKGNVLFQNVFSLAGCALLALLTAAVALRLIAVRRWWRSPWFYGIALLSAAGLPIATSIILLISPEVTYHLLMRYQWVLYPIAAVAFLERYDAKSSGGETGQPEACASGERTMPWCETGQPEACASGERPVPWRSLVSWGTLVSCAVLVFAYCVTDNIAYTNLEKKYEKTYAYCLRLLDRIEQTEGYYQGIPIAIVGVVGDDPYPVTDITGRVTSGMIGMNGDVLVYTGANYQAFIRSYLGATLNFLPPEAMEEMYYDPRYMEMESFPGKDSIRIIDGVMYIKTENADRGGS